MAKSVMEQLREYHLEQGLPLGMLADGPTPISWEESQKLYENPFYSNWTGFDPTGSSGKDEGTSPLSALKTFGTGALNAISVPQAAVFTLASKAIEGVTGREGMDWSDMKGGFSDDYGGLREILEQSGMDPDSGWTKWLGLAGDIVLDPLWAVAPLAKIPKTAAGVAKTATAAKSPKAQQSLDLAKAFGSLTDEVGVAATKTPAVTDVASLLTPLAKSGKNIADEAVSAPASASKGGKELGPIEKAETKPVLREKNEAAARPIDAATGYEIVSPSGLPLPAVSRTERMLSDRSDAMLNHFNSTDYSYGVRFGWKPTRGIKNLSEVDAAKKVRFGDGKVEIRLTPAWSRSLTNVGRVSKALRMVLPLPVEQFARRVESSTNELKYGASRTVQRQKKELENSLRERLPNATDADIEAALIKSTEAMAYLGMVRGAAVSDKGYEFATEFQKALTDSGVIGDAELKILNQWQGRFYEHTRGRVKAQEGMPREADYFPQSPDKATRESIYKYNREQARKQGKKDAPKDRGTDPEEQRTMGSLFSYFTEDDFEKKLIDLLGDEQSAGYLRKLASDAVNEAAGTSTWLKIKAEKQGRVAAGATDDNALKQAALRFYGFRDSTDADDFTEMTKDFMLEEDFFNLVLNKEHKFLDAMGDEAMVDLYVKAGVLERVQVARGGKVTERLVNTNKDPDAFDFLNKSFEQLKKPASFGEDYGGYGNKALRFSRGLKLFFTQPWPQHYWNNMLGDFFNSMVSLGFWEAGKNTIKSGLMRGTDDLSRLARMDDLKAFWHYAADGTVDMSKGRNGRKIYTVAGVEYTGEELLALAHMSGIGRGFTGEIGQNMAAEIGAAMKMFEPTSNPLSKYGRMMQRNNVRREDAMRLRTWVSHMERNGGDPMKAALQTIDGVFDYGSLTRFEKLWMRNIVMFYTWMRLNTPYQVRSMVKNPALYSAYGDIERAREKSPYEPGYVGEMGLLPIPGFGNISIGAPWADLHKIPMPIPGVKKDEGVIEKFASDYGSAVNPLFRLPVELMANKSLFTGAPIEKYDGALMQPSTPFLAELSNKLGIGQMARMRKDGEMVAAVPSAYGYIADSITGPLGTFSRFTKADDDSYDTPVDWITHFAGIGKRVKEKDSWARAAEQQASREKANETRRRNATSQNPNYTGG